MRVLIPKQTAAHAAVKFYFHPQHIGCSVQVDGDLAANEITVTLGSQDHTDVTTAYDQDGVAMVLSATNPLLPIYQSCILVFTKGITANAVGLNIVGIE